MDHGRTLAWALRGAGERLGLTARRRQGLRRTQSPHDNVAAWRHDLVDPVAREEGAWRAHALLGIGQGADVGAKRLSKAGS